MFMERVALWHVKGKKRLSSEMHQFFWERISRSLINLLPSSGASRWWIAATSSTWPWKTACVRTMSLRSSLKSSNTMLFQVHYDNYVCTGCSRKSAISCLELYNSGLEAPIWTSRGRSEIVRFLAFEHKKSMVLSIYLWENCIWIELT